ncbi:MAG TPA: hypothetical protein ACFYEL_08790, partial [Candidatus Wunengus californicus]|uniref:hypothetical protein n=1 Tax=Candidatus Wunengus californicus TaxID=3367619 RepID=UPI004028B850
LYIVHIAVKWIIPFHFIKDINMETEIRTINICEAKNLNERIKKECSEMGELGYHLMSSFVLKDVLVLIFQPIQFES